MARTARGDRDAFALVYARHAPPIMSFLAHALADRVTAEDLCQETFVRAFRASPRFRPGAPLAPWLFRIARNLTATEFRRRRSARTAPLVRLEGRGSDPAAATSELEPALAAALASLSERLRIAFVLVRMQGQSYEAAAALLAVPVGTVKSRAAAAEAALRRRLAAFVRERSR